MKCPLRHGNIQTDTDRERQKKVCYDFMRIRGFCSVTNFGFFHMHDLVVSCKFHFCKKITESSVIFLRNGVLILNGKENREASAICFEIGIPQKKNEELLRKVPLKIYEVT